MYYSNKIIIILSGDPDWWNQIKVRTSKKESKVLFKRGEIWWCRVGLNVGEEIFGKGIQFLRPILVFRKFTSNSFLGLALTTQEKKGSWYAETILNNKKRFVMLNQARIFDKKRLVERIGTIEDCQFIEVKNRFVDLYSS